MTWKPHVTVAAVVPDGERFLLVEERIEGRRVYNQPAGHLEPGESLTDAVVRETAEETGLDFEPGAIVGIYRWTVPQSRRTYLRVAFAGRAVQPAIPRQLDPAIERILWLNRADLGRHRDRLRSPMVLTVVDDYLAGRRYPLEILQDV